VNLQGVGGFAERRRSHWIERAVYQDSFYTDKDDAKQITTGLSLQGTSHSAHGGTTS
jgi:hypothetical protein